MYLFRFAGRLALATVVILVAGVVMYALTQDPLGAARHGPLSLWWGDLISRVGLGIVLISFVFQVWHWLFPALPIPLSAVNSGYNIGLGIAFWPILPFILLYRRFIRRNPGYRSPVS